MFDLNYSDKKWTDVLILSIIFGAIVFFIVLFLGNLTCLVFKPDVLYYEGQTEVFQFSFFAFFTVTVLSFWRMMITWKSKMIDKRYEEK